jgi:hypothetical protein
MQIHQYTNSHKQVFHPNIDMEGKVCLNILRDDWKPVLDIGAVINGLFFLFLVSGSCGIFSDVFFSNKIVVVHVLFSLIPMSGNCCGYGFAF